MARKACVMKDVACYWTATGRRLGILKTFPRKSDARQWVKERELHGAKILKICVPWKDRKKFEALRLHPRPS